jgi:tetratricopeptide (TPR) repeat protein
MKLKLLKISGFLFFLSFTMVYGQKGVEDGSKYGHGEDSIRCIRNLSLSHEYVKNRNYKDAVKFWRVAYNECPRGSKNIYIDGVRIYKRFIKETDDEVKQSAYVDTIMMIYDQRIKYYNQKGNVLGRKGVDLLRYRRNDPVYIEEAYNYLKESIELEETKSSYAVLATFITSSITLYKNDVFEAEQVVEDYAKVSEILDFLLKKKPNHRTLNRLKGDIDENFAGSGAASCEVLVDLFTEKYNENKDDAETLENIVGFLKDSECTETELYFNASASLHEIEPSAISASGLASMAMSNGNFKVADNYLRQAVEMETDNVKKGEYYFNLAYVHNQMGDKLEARKNALKAAELKENWGEPYIFIGNLYANSAGECSDIDLPNAIYWAAVDKFSKAKVVDPSVEERANKLISTYTQYYPNKENAFFLGINEGGSYKVACWINETTTVRF